MQPRHTRITATARPHTKSRAPSDPLVADCEARVVEACATPVLSLRIGAGADVISALVDVLRSHNHTSVAIVCAVGSLSSIDLCTVTAEGGKVAYTNRRRLEGAIEVCSLAGHLSLDASGQPAGHFHGAFALEDGTMVGGHIFDARVLVTLELTLLAPAGVVWTVDQVSADAPFGAGMRYLTPVHSGRRTK